LLELRNKLLVYRLWHYYDEIPNVELNIKDREKQLFKSTFRVFQNSHKALQELKIGINKYLSEYRQRRSNTFHAFLYKVVTDLIKTEKTFELKTALIWTKLKDELHGMNIPKLKLNAKTLALLHKVALLRRCEKFLVQTSRGTAGPDDI
jgi:hypothetical protein